MWGWVRGWLSDTQVAHTDNVATQRHTPGEVEDQSSVSLSQKASKDLKVPENGGRQGWNP